MARPLFIADAFAREPFTGNPAAVCLLETTMDDERMAKIAAEMNLSETAFVERDGTGGFGLRWFAPKAEVDLCGHATLAAAHVLWEQGWLSRSETARFSTRSGRLTADWEDGEIVMDFPAEAPAPTAAPNELIEGLGLIPKYVGRNRMDYVVEIDGEEAVRSLRPDYGMLARLDARGVIVTSRGKGDDCDFVSRAFFPVLGVNEDPVTGSAHCALAPYWEKRLRKSGLTGYQASERGGYVGVRTIGDRVQLRGRAVTVLRGQLEG